MNPETPEEPTVRLVGDAAVIVPAGELTLHNSPRVEQELESLLPAIRIVILDLRSIEFIDSTGISVIVRGQQRAKEKGQRFAVVRGNQAVQRLLRLTAVDERISLVDTPEELLPEA